MTKLRVGQIEKQLRSKLADHFTRSFGADGVKNMIRASFDALTNQTSPKSVAQRRGK